MTLQNIFIIREVTEKAHACTQGHTSSPGRSCWSCSRGGCPPGTPADRRCSGPSGGLLWPNLAGARFNTRITDIQYPHDQSRWLVAWTGLSEQGHSCHPSLIVYWFKNQTERNVRQTLSLHVWQELVTTDCFTEGGSSVPSLSQKRGTCSTCSSFSSLLA